MHDHIHSHDSHSHGHHHEHEHSHGHGKPDHDLDNDSDRKAQIPEVVVASHTPSSHVRSQSLNISVQRNFDQTHLSPLDLRSLALQNSANSPKQYTRPGQLSITSQSPSQQNSPLLLPSSSPLTPSYRFGHDDHFDTHHHSEHVPNLHDHTHKHEHHEGHSHNMRGVFLHVMAVSTRKVHYKISDV